MYGAILSEMENVGQYLYIVKSLEFGSSTIYSTKCIGHMMSYYNNENTLKITHIYKLLDPLEDLCYKLNASIRYLYDDIVVHYLILKTWPNVNVDLKTSEDQIVECFLSTFGYKYHLYDTDTICDADDEIICKNEQEKAVKYFNSPEIQKYLPHLYKYVMIHKVLGFLSQFIFGEQVLLHSPIH